MGLSVDIKLREAGASNRMVRAQPQPQGIYDTSLAKSLTVAGTVPAIFLNITDIGQYRQGTVREAQWGVLKVRGKDSDRSLALKINETIDAVQSGKFMTWVSMVLNAAKEVWR